MSMASSHLLLLVFVLFDMRTLVDSSCYQTSCTTCHDGMVTIDLEGNAGITGAIPGLTAIQNVSTQPGDSTPCSKTALIQVVFDYPNDTDCLSLLRIDLEFGESRKARMFNFGDSRTNNGAGGDASTSSNDAEIDNAGDGIYVYQNDKCGTQISHSYSGALDSSVNSTTFLIGDQYFKLNNSNGLSDEFCDEHDCLFALSGQSDEEAGSTNQIMYFGFNRVVTDNFGSRSGHGTCKVQISWQCSQTDLDECSVLNGGCQDKCTNTIGSRVCSCHGNRTLSEDGRSCTGILPTDDVFKRYNIPRALLPRGCDIMELGRCRDDRTIEFFLSSTSQWYMFKTDSSVFFTQGLVFIEVNSLSLPISVTGVTVDHGNDGFKMTIGSNQNPVSDGILAGTKRSDECLAFDVTAGDIADFVENLSFLKSVFDSISAALPNWARFDVHGLTVLDVHGMKSDLVYGDKIDDISWCKGAPVLSNHLYSVFQFDSSFFLNIYDRDAFLPVPSRNNNFCLIVDLCQNFGGTVFLMIPKDSRSLITQMDVFSRLHQKYNVLINPAGIGVSAVSGIKVPNYHTPLTMWNGDQLFKYDIPERADLWISGSMIKLGSTIEAHGDVSMYISVPSVDRILTGLFIDEWNMLLNVKFSATPRLKFRMFGNTYSITFDDLIEGTTEAFSSVGGRQNRQWCGSTANPPGIFVSLFVSINPFRNVPILKDWVLENNNKIYAFLSTEPFLNVSTLNIVEILPKISELAETVKQLRDSLISTIQTFHSFLPNALNDIIDNLIFALDELQSFNNANKNQILQGNVNTLTTVWKLIKDVENAIFAFFDKVEHSVNTSTDSIVNLIKEKYTIIKQKFGDIIRQLVDKLDDQLDDYIGFGLKFRTTLSVFGLDIPSIDIELVSSSNLMVCSRFTAVKEILRDVKGVRFLGTLTRTLSLGYFLESTFGTGLGGVFGINSDVVLLHIHAHASMIGIKASVDVFIGNTILHFSLLGNIWGLFVAEITVSSPIDRNWNMLNLRVEGKFAAAQPTGTSFQKSFRDALIDATQMLSNAAEKRIRQAQAIVMKAQTALSKAQAFLSDKQRKVQDAQVVFDNAIAALERAKQKLEDAKGPFEAAIAILREAQKNVDDLCKIKSCSIVCIAPFVKVKFCSKKFISIPCGFETICLLHAPDPFCVAYNTGCEALRLVAYTALEAAQIFVKVPIAAFNLAQSGLSAAQIVVDESRVVLTAAQVLLKGAEAAVQVARQLLNVPKLALEALKIALKGILKVGGLIIQYGIQSIIDVRECGFLLELTTYSPSVFDVSCDVNLFRLGWKRIGMRINFKFPFETIWQSALSTVHLFLDQVKVLNTGRRRRDTSSIIRAETNLLLRNVRQAVQESPTEEIEKINIINITNGFSHSIVTDFENRVELYKYKCTTITNILAFLNDTWGDLYDVISDQKIFFDEVIKLKSQLPNYTATSIREAMTLASIQVDKQHAFKDYDLTEQNLMDALEEAKSKIHTDPLIEAIISATESAKGLVESDLDTLTLQWNTVVNEWIIAVESVIHLYFSASDCAGFQDCTLFAITQLNGLYFQETHQEASQAKQVIQEIENGTGFLQESSFTFETILKSSESVLLNVHRLAALSMFCSKPPHFLRPLTNNTVIKGQTTIFTCHATADPSPTFWWLKDNEFLPEEHARDLTIVNSSPSDEGVYQCIAGNVVANITSNEAWLQTLDPLEGKGEINKGSYIRQPKRVKFTNCSQFLSHIVFWLRFSFLGFFHLLVYVN